MSSTMNDRIDGVTTSVAVKAPCRVAALTNISLYGTQTVNGVAVVANDRVLVLGQTNKPENGIYIVSSTSWQRAADFDGTRDVRKGTIVLVNEGASGGRAFSVSSDDPIYIETSDIEFESAPTFSGDEVVISVADYAAVRLLSSPLVNAKFLCLEGRATNNDGGQGVFLYKGSGYSSSDDDDGINLVDASGRLWVRWMPQPVREISVEWFGAKADDPTFDNSSAFANAFAIVLAAGAFNTGTGPWPATNKYSLVGEAGDYYFSDQFITPSLSAPNFSNFDIRMPGAVFKPTASYDHTKSLIHMRCAFDYEFEFGVDGFDTTSSYVIFNDSSRANNYGGRCKYKIKFANTKLGIRHELESSVVDLELMCDEHAGVEFIRFWRCDQAEIHNSFFNWSQVGRSDWDSLIVWNKDDGVTAESQFPGNGTYNAGRLTVRDSMFIPTGAPASPVKTAWICNQGGHVLVTDGCHFGPESINRPITVLNNARGATYSSVDDQVEASVTIENCSAISSFAQVYCKDHYPNKICVRNLRWNELQYSNPAGSMTYAIGGLTALNSATRYSYANMKYFQFEVDCGGPLYRGINDIQPDLDFAYRVTRHAELVMPLSTEIANVGGTTLYYEIGNRDGLFPAIPQPGTYIVDFTGVIASTAQAKSFHVSMQYLVNLGRDGNDMTIGVKELYKTDHTTLGSLPSITATYVNPSNAEVATVTRANIDAGQAYRMRIKAMTNLSGNTWTAANARIRRII